MQFERLRKVKTADDFRRAIRPNLATIGREVAERALRERPFSRSYMHHVLYGDYAPSDVFVSALSAWFAAYVVANTKGRVTGRLIVNGRWSVTLECAQCGRRWSGNSGSKCKCAKP